MRTRLSHAARLGALALFSLLPLAAAEPAAPAPSHFDLRREGVAAYQRKDYAAARAAFRAALALRPDSPRYLYNLAAVSALAGEEAAALDYLRRLAALGVVMPVERDRDFAALQGKPAFREILAQLAAAREPRGAAEIVAELPGRTGIVEGIAFRARTGDMFLSDVHHRCIWKRDADGRVTRFSSEDDELLGVFGLALDEARQTLWAATAALPEIAGYSAEWKGRAALAEFDLRTSELRRVIPVPGDGREHALGDLTLSPDGTIYATDAKAPVIWRRAPGEEEMVKAFESPLFASLQGVVVVRRTLLVADYPNGLFAIDLASGEIAALAAPKDTTLLGLDGIASVADGLVATQNGIEPQRLVHIALAADLRSITRVTVLASGLPQFTDLTLVTLVDGRPTCIAGAGWDGFNPEKAKQPAAHTVRLFQSSLP